MTGRTACWFVACGPARGIARGIPFGIAFGIAANIAHADMLDFEDLPSLLTEHPDGGSAALYPDYAYHGFNFSAIHNAYPYVSNSWRYAKVPESLQDQPPGGVPYNFRWGIESGEFALTTPPGGVTEVSRFSSVLPVRTAAYLQWTARSSRETS